MAIIATSDLTGDLLKGDVESFKYKLVLQQGGKNVHTIDEIYLSEDDVDQIKQKLKDQKPIIPTFGTPSRSIKQAAAPGTNATAKDSILLDVLKTADVDKQEVSAHVKAKGYNWGGKRFSVDTLKQVIKDKGLEAEAAAAGVPVND